MITQLVEIMGVKSVQRCVSIVLEYHGGSSHDETTHDVDFRIIYAAGMFAIYRLIELMDQEGSDL